MSEPLVSVVMATKDPDDYYFLDAVESILKQDYENWELIIVDYGSRPEFIATIRSVMHDDRRVRLLEGVYDETGTPTNDFTSALVLGCVAARGKYIARQDADDMSYPNRLSIQVAVMEHAHNISVLGSTAVEIDKNNMVSGIRRVPTRHNDIKRAMRWASPMIHGSVMIRKSSYDKVFGYRIEMTRAQDCELWCRMAAKGMGFDNLPSKLYKLRVHGGSTTSTHRIEQVAYGELAREIHLRGRIWWVDDFIRRVRERKGRPWRLVRRFLAREAVFECKKKGDRLGMLKALTRSLEDPRYWLWVLRRGF